MKNIKRCATNVGGNYEMNKWTSWSICIIFSIFCKLALMSFILIFTYKLIQFTGSMNCLWLLFLLLTVDLIPIYSFSSEPKSESELIETEKGETNN